MKKIVKDVLKHRGFDLRSVRYEGDKIFVPDGDGGMIFHSTGFSIFNSDDAQYIREQNRVRRSLMAGCHLAKV